ncbi:MAG: hypothetical protein IKI97_10205 [Clostridia bacterium]|nr:hypothetical protein [Clostridia bacterium]
MKKISLMAIFSIALLMCTVYTASAEDFSENSDGSYTVEITGKTPGKSYSIIVVSGDYTNKDMPEINEDNIIYINQTTADENGVVLFSDFIPMTDSVGTIYIGGDTLPSNEGILMNDNGMLYAAGRLLKYSGNDTVVTLPEHIDEIAEGAFKDAQNVEKVIIKNGSVTIFENAFNKGVKLFFSPVAQGAIQYAAQNGYSYGILGDYNGDSTVDGNDLTASLLGYATGARNQTSDYSIIFDLDFNGSVNMRDASILLKYLGGKISDYYKAFTSDEING